ASKIYGTPRALTVGYKISREEVASELRKAGYTEENEKGESKLGNYRLLNDGIQVRPGPESFHSPDGALIKFTKEGVESISSLDKSSEIGQYELDALLGTVLLA